MAAQNPRWGAPGRWVVAASLSCCTLPSASASSSRAPPCAAAASCSAACSAALGFGLPRFPVFGRRPVEGLAGVFGLGGEEDYDEEVYDDFVDVFGSDLPMSLAIAHPQGKVSK